MPQWSGSDRRSRLPADWVRIRARILKRDGYRCTHLDDLGERCAEPASDVDHVLRGDDHRDVNLTSLCGWHHRQKSSREGAAAKAANWRRQNAKFRRTEEHPGLL